MLTNDNVGGNFMNMFSTGMSTPVQMPMQVSNVQYMPMPKLATAYVPFQYLNSIYPPMQGLERGTIFPDLDRPYGADPEYTYDA